MKFLLAKKQYMTQVFGEDGRVSPATVLSTGALTVTQVKSVEKDGYSALQVGFGKRKESNVSKAVKGHIKGAVEEGKAYEALKEFRMDTVGEAKKGDAVMGLDTFAIGDKVTVSGVSKGKGFQGVVKRHGFKGGPRSHGQKH